MTGFAVNKGKHDPFLIQHRIRLFQAFLSNIRDHPTLASDHVFHLFVDANQDWADAITTIESRLPHSLRSGGALRKPKIPDPLFVRLEAMNVAYRAGIKSIEQGERRLLKRLKGTV